MYKRDVCLRTVYNFALNMRNPVDFPDEYGLRRGTDLIQVNLLNDD